ncbi:MAG: hypothetical protein HY899_04910 [Deltaproteobacteria bacterium]|nr:hypothetical protein [Deltaproteobacteria bacterium]
MANRADRIAGCDLGKASASFVVTTIDQHGRASVESSDYQLHDGKPLELFRRWYREYDIASCAVLGATGIYADDLIAPALVLPEDSCQEAALELDGDLQGPLNLVSIGARGYGVLSRREIGGNNGSSRYFYQYLENDKCSSGAGENIQKMAARFGLAIEQADELASRAKGLIPITARCSVFAKSEMTHFANQGKPTSDLFNGYFASVARNTYSLLARNRVDGPVYMIGGCAQIDSLRRAFEALLGHELSFPRNPLIFEALGAAALAARQVGGHTRDALPSDPGDMIHATKKRFAVLERASNYRERVMLMTASDPAADIAGVPTVLGLDLGSTGAKAVLTSLATGEAVLDVYDRTKGNPVDAARRLIGAVLERGGADVRAIGVTGSGREAVATLLRAVFPQDDRVMVLNEIVAHATAAIRCDSEAGADLSVIEIGGQDAKYIRVQGGRIVDSDMNKACSAGTGSFLEEQAAFYDVADIDDFTALASAAKRPPDLGLMCTVYVAEAASEALKEGFELGDLFAGFQYSVIHNYLSRVMGQRTLGRRIFFQGKPASNPSLAWTLAAVSGREIVVPPNPGAMGAWGIGLCVSQQLGAEALSSAESLDLQAVLDAQITERSEFQCRDSECQTLCPIERTTISVGGETRVAISGGACPKFEVSTRNRPKLDKLAPNPFEARSDLIASYLTEIEGAPIVAIPQAGAVDGHIPWLATLVRELGFSPRLLRSDSRSLAVGEQMCNSFDSCGPAKITHAICDTDARWLLFPKIFNIADPSGYGGQTCVTEQAMPEIIEQSLKARGKSVTVLRPRLAFDEGLASPKLVENLASTVRALGADAGKLERAVAKAAAAQQQYERELKRIGDEALAYARANSLPAVLVCGQLHVVHDRAINASIPLLLRENGAMAIPVDCFPVDREIPRMKKVYWGDANRLMRAAQQARLMGDVFPLLICSFGCGPGSFTEQVFQSLLEGYPHSILESDGHGGTAGFVTRIQIFLQSVRQFLGEDGAYPVPDNSRLLTHVGPTARTGPYMDPAVRYVFLSAADFFGDVFAAAYRAFGYDAVAAPAITKESYACGKRDCSGKECMSYQMVWGSFRAYLEENPPAKETRLVQISGQMCRAGLFDVKDKISIDAMGLGELVKVTGLRISGGPVMTMILWSGLAALDIIRQLHVYHLGSNGNHASADALLAGYGKQVIAVIERPMPEGWARVRDLRARWVALTSILKDASETFGRVGDSRAAEHDFRTVFVSGDILTKGNDFANDHLYYRMSERGLRVVVEPTCDFLDYLVRRQPHLLFGRGGNPRQMMAYRANMIFIRKRFYAAVRKRHAWLPMPDVAAALAKSETLIDTATVGGAAVAIGSVLHHWDTRRYDGVVMAACWGCDNALVEESLLRHRKEIPFLFYYDDGTPMDERRVSSFAFRLRGSPRTGEMRALSA